MTVCSAEYDVQGSTVILHGEFDIAALEDLERALDAALADPARREVVIDLGATTFIDSVTISALMGARTRAEADGRRMTLRGVGPRLARVLALFAPAPPFHVAA